MSPLNECFQCSVHLQFFRHDLLASSSTILPFNIQTSGRLRAVLGFSSDHVHPHFSLLCHSLLARNHAIVNLGEERDCEGSIGGC